MNLLTTLYDQLAAALTADPLLLLASAVATFDPCWAAFDAEVDYEDDPLTVALQITRGVFPDIYAAAVERLRAGASYAEMDRLLCRAIAAKGIPLADLDVIGWGLPLTAVGVELEDPEFYAAHAELLPMLALFGIQLPEGEAYSVEVPECAYAAGRAVAASLLEQTDLALRQMGWLFGWLFSCTGNSLVDYSDETLAEIPPLSWSPEDIAFGIELIEEADGIMRDVEAGIDTLKFRSDLRAALECNIRTLYQAVGANRNPKRFCLHW